MAMAIATTIQTVLPASPAEATSAETSSVDPTIVEIFVHRQDGQVAADLDSTLLMIVVTYRQIHGKKMLHGWCLQQVHQTTRRSDRRLKCALDNHAIVRATSWMEIGVRFGIVTSRVLVLSVLTSKPFGGSPTSM
jgi:hypothetical protein